MGWARLDDRRHTNARLNALCAIDAIKGLAANGLDANAITYCAANETDGFVDDASLVQLAPGASKKQRDDLTVLLSRVGRWERDDDRCGWWVHDYLDFHPSRADLERKRADDRQRKASQKRSPAGQFHADSGRNPSGGRPDSTATPTDPIPSPPDPSHPDPGEWLTSPDNLGVVARDVGDDAAHPGGGEKLRDLVVRLTAACTGNHRETVAREAALVVALCLPHTPPEVLERAIAIIEPKRPRLPRYVFQEVERQRRLAGLPAVALSLDLVGRVPA